MNVLFIIIGLLVMVCAIILLAINKYKKLEHDYNGYEHDATDGEKKVNRSPIFVALAVGLALVVFGGSFTIIPTGSTGVKTTFGQVDSHTLSAGFNWKLPFIQSIEEVNNKQQDVCFDSRISAETQKRTTIHYNNIVVTYQLGAKKSAWLYANVTDYKNLVTNSLVSSAIKSSSKTLSDEDATNRSKIEPLVAEYLQNSLNEKYGEDTIIINKVIIKDADFEKSYNEAIAAKQKAQLQSEKQAIENKKNIEKAEADAKVKKTKAMAAAEAKLIKSEATAKANKLLEKSLTSEILQQLYLEKWDGKLPTYMTGDNSSVLFNAGK